MKKYLLSAVIALLCMQAWCQDEAIIIKGSLPISKKLTPQQVIDSLNKRFPDAHAVKYYKIPPDAVSKGWTISKEDNLGMGETIDYYTITFKRSDVEYYGLFRADGSLVRSKQEETVEHLPDAVKKSISTLSADHPGYTVTSKKYYRNLDENSMDEYYEVIAQNGNTKKSLYFKPDGTLTKIK
jgi:hypothetical protein